MSSKPLILPDPTDPKLTRRLTGLDQNGNSQNLFVVEERPLTIFLNQQEIITAMTIGDHPDYLAIGFLLNQKMLLESDEIKRIEYDEELETIIVRTNRKTSYEEKLQKKIRTSGCAVGTVFGDMFEGLDSVKLSKVNVKTSWLYSLSKQINTIPSLYLTAGAIHGTVICRESKPLVYMEDVGRHNAVDKVIGSQFRRYNLPLKDNLLVVSSRASYDIVQKAVSACIPMIVAVGAPSSLAIDLSQQYGITLVGFARENSFNVYSGHQRIKYA